MTPENQLPQVTRSKRKQISFFASVLIVIGSCIGAGIFFKSHDVLGFSGGNVIFSTIVWVIAAFTVLCLALALIEVSSACHDNLSLIGWCKKFNRNWIYKGCKYYMVYIYLPHMYFGMPVYAIMPFLDALKGFGVSGTGFGTNCDWLIWMVIVLVIATYFILTSGFYSRVGNVQNMVCQAGKFLPILVISIIAIAILATTKEVKNTSFYPFKLKDGDHHINPIFNLTPFIGIFGSLAAIFFAYDGFYEAAGVKTEMKEPRKIPKAFILGIGIVTVLYVILTLLMSLASEGGNFSGTVKGSFNSWMQEKGLGWLYGIVSLLISLGVLGILNNFTMWAPRYVEDLIQEGEIYVPPRYLKRLNPHFPKVGNLFLLILSIPVVIGICVIAALAYFTSPDRIKDYGESFGRFASFADLIGSWTALFNFVFIALAVLGAIRNRKTKRVQVEQYKHFVWTGYFSSIVILTALIFSALQPFIDLIILSTNYGGWDKTMASAQRQDAIAQLLTCLLLFAFLGASFGFIPLEKWLLKRRTKNLENILFYFDNETNRVQLTEWLKLPRSITKKMIVQNLQNHGLTNFQANNVVRALSIKISLSTLIEQYRLENAIALKALDSFKLT